MVPFKGWRDSGYALPHPKIYSALQIIGQHAIESPPFSFHPFSISLSLLTCMASASALFHMAYASLILSCLVILRSSLCQLRRYAHPQHKADYGYDCSHLQPFLYTLGNSPQHLC